MSPAQIQQIMLKQLIEQLPEQEQDRIASMAQKFLNSGKAEGRISFLAMTLAGIELAILFEKGQFPEGGLHG